MNDFFYKYSKCRRKIIDLIFKVLKLKVKNAFISVIEWLRISAWYLKTKKNTYTFKMNIFLTLDEQQIYTNSIMSKILYADIVNYSVIEWPSIMSRNP